ncbi:MAG: hypothetical protein KGZ80_06410 [Methylomonas sp.]|nr:hypothetical protein [Methylomonas sp.]
MKMRFAKLIRTAAIAVAGSLVTACDVSKERLDEAVFYDGPRFRLKLVRYYENYPLHFSGEVFRIQCTSDRTGNAGTAMQDPGWVMVGQGAAIGSKSAQEVVERERRNYHVLGDEILAWTGNGLNVSFDACGQFRFWYPANLPADLIVPADKPDICAPKGKVDCRNYDFQGDRAPKFEAIWADAQGTVSFLVRSNAFRDNQAVRLRSNDYGKTWTFTTVNR